MGGSCAIGPKLVRAITGTNKQIMHRKEFLKMSSLAVAGLSMPKLITSALASPNQQTDQQVIIVGTGYGAAVAALRLAEKGIRGTYAGNGDGLEYQRPAQYFLQVAESRQKIGLVAHTQHCSFC